MATVLYAKESADSYILGAKTTIKYIKNSKTGQTATSGHKFGFKSNYATKLNTSLVDKEGNSCQVESLAMDLLERRYGGQQVG